MRRAPRIARLVVAFAALAALILLGRQAGGYVLGFAAWVQGLGAWGPVVFIAGYVLATVAFVPGVVLTLAAGVIFGEPGDAVLLGAFTLEALGLCLDPLKRELLPIPMILAACGEAALTHPSPRRAHVAPCA